MKKKAAVSLDLKDVKIKDRFLRKYISLVKDVILEYQWNAMNDNLQGAPKSHCIENFRIAAGEAQGEFYGMVFQDSDLAKWLEAAAYTLTTVSDEELQKRVEDMIALVGRAQCADGYLNTYFTIKEPEQRWKNLREGHELYTAGHFMEAAAACSEMGNRELLDIMCRMADVICDYFGPEEGKCHGYSGHPEVELALVRLYRASGNRKYLEMAKYFVDIRGCGENYFLKEMKSAQFHPIFSELNEYDPVYSQSHLPVREQKTAEGHAVRAVYLYSAMADIAGEYGDEELLGCCEDLWNNIVEKRMYITGSIGSSGYLERFTTDYDLPNVGNYSESCASVGLMMFGLRMAQITRDASYMDIVERALYNTVLAGIAMDGKSFFYVNPLEVWPPACMENTSLAHVKPVRQKWFGVACCPPNIARTLASLGKYIYGADEDTLYINLFAAGEVCTEVGKHKVKLEVETDFPTDGHVTIHIKEWQKGCRLAIRIPSYAEKAAVRGSEGKAVGGRMEKGYFYLEPTEGELQIDFEMKTYFMHANGQVRADAGRVCLMRGPLVYTFEEADNGSNLESFYIDTSKSPSVCMEKGLLGGTVTIRVEALRMEGGPKGLYGTEAPRLIRTGLKAIPYAFWCNRNRNEEHSGALAGEMCVWMKELILEKNVENSRDSY